MHDPHKAAPREARGTMLGTRDYLSALSCAEELQVSGDTPVLQEPSVGARKKVHLALDIHHSTVLLDLFDGVGYHMHVTREVESLFADMLKTFLMLRFDRIALSRCGHFRAPQ